jgi:predicted acetyltransferase
MKLICLWDADPHRAYALHQSFGQDENGFVNAAYGLSEEEFTVYIEQKKKEAQGIDLPKGYVPATEYLLVDDAGQYAGIFNLRHELNAYLAEHAGHIGYGIAKEYRGRGYASAGLALVLQEARKHGIATAYLSVNKNNPASLKVQKKNGAYIDHEDDQEYYTRIVLDPGK